MTLPWATVIMSTRTLVWIISPPLFPWGHSPDVWGSDYWLAALTSSTNSFWPQLVFLCHTFLIVIICLTPFSLIFSIGNSVSNAMMTTVIWFEGPVRSRNKACSQGLYLYPDILLRSQLLFIFNCAVTWNSLIWWRHLIVQFLKSDSLPPLDNQL